MNIERREISIASHPQKKKLLQSSNLRALWNHIGRRKNYMNCFGCSDNLWWKEDVSIAFRKPDYEDSVWSEEEDLSPPKKQNFLEIPQKDSTLIVYRHGVVICSECFVKKSEEQLSEVFEKVKKLWLKNKTTSEEIERTRNYQLFLPIRTTKGTFKREISATAGVSHQSFSGSNLLRKVFSLLPSYFTPNNS